MGYAISIPYGNGERYDFVADINGKLIKVQCKSCKRVNKDYDITFKCVSNRGSKSKKYSKEEIDYICTYWKRKCYLVPIEKCNCSIKSLRIKNIRAGKPDVEMAEQYELHNMIKKINA